MNPDEENKAPPGPDDVVTVEVGGKHTTAESPAIERGAGATTHPEGSEAPVPDQVSPTL